MNTPKKEFPREVEQLAGALESAGRIGRQRELLQAFFANLRVHPLDAEAAAQKAAWETL